MTEMKCPICQQELEIVFKQVGHNLEESYLLCNKCNLRAERKLWQALIKIKKELDIRKKQVEIANKAFDFISIEWDNPDCSRKELGACAFNAKEDIAGWESDIETAEQKDE